MNSEDQGRTITRIIARLNVGGPAIQAISLTRFMEAHGYRTHLVRGLEGPEEGNMDYLARKLDVQPTLIKGFQRDPGVGDLRALGTLVRILRRDRPTIVHTHAAKAGTLGRLAALLAFPRRSSRPLMVHTYHGHSLTGYFSDRTARFYQRVERILARYTDCLVAVSPEVRNDLVALGVAPMESFEVVPLGFDLSEFLDEAGRPKRRAALRAEWGIDPDAEVVTLIARLVPIKRVDRFLRVAHMLSDRPGIRFVIVGDGELRTTLRGSAEAISLGDRVLWTGFRTDIADVCFASDLVMLTSDNEGTPVSLIEAQAAGVPVVATDVGGVRSAVRDGISGFVVPPHAEAELANVAGGLLDDPERAADSGVAGREYARARFAISRLLEDHASLYQKLVTSAMLHS